MKLLKVGSAVLNQTPLDWGANKANILKAIREARSQGVALLCLPELCISGYGCEDAFLSPALLRTSWDVFQEILPETKGIVVSLGLPMSHNNVVFNAAGLVVDGKVAGFVAKRYLARSGIHYEPRWFKPWPVGQKVDLRIDGQTYPFGDIYFDCGGVKIAFEICEDAWVSDRPGGNMFLKGIDVIFNPSASHFAFGKQRVRERFVLEGSRAFGVTYLYSNLLGNEAGRAIYDGGALIASGGQMLAAGPRFSFRDQILTTTVADLDLTRMTQAKAAGMNRSSGEDGPDCIEINHKFQEIGPEAPSLSPDSWETSSDIKSEEFTRAISLGLFDYLRKSRSRGFVVSLSGGADSSAVACLVGLMVKLSISEVGTRGFSSKLSYIAGLKKVSLAEEAIAVLLTCAYQSTRNSSDTTRNAARKVADALNASFYEFDVDQLVSDYVSMVSSEVGRELTWQQDDVALQNIQARVRAPGVWLMANLKNALLLSTSNRSEAAVGYATMDGDTCGGLSPIAGIDKAFLKHWLLWLQSKGPEGVGPIPELEAVTAQAPTAELRPGGKQTDEADLMPYDLLDAIERAAIRDKKNPLEVYRIMRSRFPEYERMQLGSWTEKFFRLWCRNQWKRERYAPSFHVDDANLDPKTWCRFPILSGGFERELQELREHIAGEIPGEPGAALIVVDLQNDFCPGGALPVPGGHEVVPLANRLMGKFELVLATQDWHPPDHGSFAASHPGRNPGDEVLLGGIPQTLWPVHCVHNTAGAEFVENLRRDRISQVFHKGTDREIDSYSCFYDNAHQRATGLGDYLKERNVQRVYILGLATDYCVKFSALDAVNLDFETFVISDGCRGINLNPGDSDEAFQAMEAAGVRIVLSADV